MANTCVPMLQETILLATQSHTKHVCTPGFSDIPDGSAPHQPVSIPVPGLPGAHYDSYNVLACNSRWQHIRAGRSQHGMCPCELRCWHTKASRTHPSQLLTVQLLVVTPEHMTVSQTLRDPHKLRPISSCVGELFRLPFRKTGSQ